MPKRSLNEYSDSELEKLYSKIQVAILGNDPETKRLFRNFAQAVRNEMDNRRELVGARNG